MVDPSISPAVEFRSVSFGFVAEDNGEHRVFNNVSLRVRKGEIVSVIGPTGCGKTTVLKLVAGLYTKGHRSANIKGDVLVEGQDATIARKEHHIGMVFQDPVLLPWRTVRQNVALATELVRTASAMKVDEMLQHVGLSEFADMNPSQLSGGMKQRVAIARALVPKPSLLLLDEPFSALDGITRENLDLFLMDLRDQMAMTVLMVTHNLVEAVFVSDRIIQFSARPARVMAEHVVPLSHPRTHKSFSDPGFEETLEKIRQAWADAQTGSRQ